MSSPLLLKSSTDASEESILDIHLHRKQRANNSWLDFKARTPIFWIRSYTHTHTHFLCFLYSTLLYCSMQVIEQLHILTNEVLRVYPSGSAAAAFLNVSQVWLVQSPSSPTLSLLLFTPLSFPVHRFLFSHPSLPTIPSPSLVLFPLAYWFFCTEINLHKQLIYFTYVMVMPIVLLYCFWCYQLL